MQKITVTDGFDYVNLFDKFGADFICQEVVKQSEQTAVFNTSSLNTFRISTLNINGRCTAENFLFRHGREGGFCDNGLANGLMVGINANGRLHPTAYDKHLTEYKVSPSGVKYADIQFRNFDKVVSFAIEAHKCYLPNMGFAGWDLCLDEQENIVFIEVNLGYPGILFEQLASSAPMFRTRTDEVYEYVLKHQHKLNWRTDFIGSAL